MFDGVHLGHQHLIAQLKAQADDAMVVTFSNHPLGIVDSSREPQLLTTTGEKEALLRGLGVTPVILRFDESLRRLTAEEFISVLARDYGINRLMLGFNNSIGSDRCRDDDEMQRIASSTGVDIVRATELAGDVKVNSSTIREVLKNGDTENAGKLLGRAYAVHGKVVHGKQLGRRLGFPTANISVNNDKKLIPAGGVYAADAVTSAGDIYRAVVNIGHRPTVDHACNAQTTIEAYLDGFTGNLYGKELELRFLSRLRDEKRFDSIEQLKSAISRDTAAARQL